MMMIITSRISTNRIARVRSHVRWTHTDTGSASGSLTSGGTARPRIAAFPLYLPALTRPQLPPLHGVFAVNKPSGVTSATVVKRIQHVLSLRPEVDTDDSTNDAAKNNDCNNNTTTVTRTSKLTPTPTRTPRSRLIRPLAKVGHGGTLDKNATGVLVIGVGDGCKQLTHFLEGDKCYLVRAQLGVATDTYDATGTAVQHASWHHVSMEDVRRALAHSFVGSILQQPPVYSAKAVNGIRASDLMRAGVSVELAPRHVPIYAATCEHSTLPDAPFVTLRIECGSGTYVRSVVHDLGRALGTCAHVVDLHRTQQGVFCIPTVVDAVSGLYRVVTVEDEKANCSWTSVLEVNQLSRHTIQRAMERSAEAGARAEAARPAGKPAA